MTDSEENKPAEPKQIVYCGVCTLPPEYCEFGGTIKQCEEWLQANHPDMHTRIYSTDTLEANLASLSLEAQERAEKDARKKAAKAESAAAREAEVKAQSKVTIKRIERTKRKHVTVIVGLDAFGLDLKKVAKDLGKKFAAGASVTKSPSGAEEITLQGDLSDDVPGFLVDKYNQVPAGNIECVEDKKNKTNS